MTARVDVPVRRPPRRRLLRRLVLVTIPVAIVVTIAMAPRLAAPFVARMAESSLEERTAARASIDSFSLSWGGARLAGLRLYGDDGTEHARLDRMEVDVDLVGALRGRYEADLRIEGMAIHAIQGPDGRWNLDGLFPPEPGPKSGPERAPGPGRGPDGVPGDGEGAGEPPRVRASVVLRDVTLDVRGQRQSGALHLDELTWKIDALDRPAPLHAEGTLSAGDLAPGAVLLDGAITAFPVPRGEVRFSAGVGGAGNEPGLACALDATREDGEARGTLALDGRVSALLALLPGALPLEEGASLDGRIDGDATFGWDDAAGGTLEAALVLRDLAGTAPDGSALDLAALGTPELRVEGSADAAAARVEVTTLAAQLGPVRLAGRASAATGGWGDGDSASLTLDADLDGLRAAVEPFLDVGERELSGTLVAELEARPSGAAVVVDGSLTATGVAFGDVRLDGAPLELSARIEGEGADGTLSTDRLALETAGGGRFEQRDVVLSYALRPRGDALEVEGELALADLAVELPATAERAAVRIAEPRLKLAAGARVDAAAGAVDVARLELESETLSGTARGTLSGLASAEDRGPATPALAASGALRYVPDRLGAVLAPWLPGSLSGSEPEELTFAVDGVLAEMELEEVLASSAGEVRVDLARYTVGGFETAGTMTATMGEGRAELAGELAANGGSLRVLGVLEGDPAAAGGTGARLSVTMDAVGVNAGVASLLSRAHPAFAAAEERADVGGLLSGELELEWDGDVRLEQLAGGWDAIPHERLSGRARLELNDAVLRASPFLAALLEGFDETGARALDVAPIELRIERGRVVYERPWTWTIRDATTRFVGSVGLDRSLDLTWQVPVTAKLVERYAFLEAVEGQELGIPIRGTALRPEIEWEGVLDELARKAVQDEVTERLGVDDLKDILRGGERGGGERGEGESAEELLARADRLWDEGDKPKAAKIYRRIRDDHKLSPTYLLNRDRIKRRGDHEE